MRRGHITRSLALYGGAICGLFLVVLLGLSLKTGLDALVLDAKDRSNATAVAFEALSDNPLLSLLKDAPNLSRTDLQTDARAAAVHKLVTEHFGELGLLKVRAFDKTLTTILSTDPTEIGENSHHPERIEQALVNNITASVEWAPQFDTPIGLRKNVFIVETYLPIFDETGKIVGAYEMYEDMSIAFGGISRSLLSLFLLTLCIVTLIFLSVLFIVGFFELWAIEKTKMMVELERRAASAQSASDIKATILSNLSHEFRTPLNAIIGFSELMKMETLGPIPDVYKGYTADILKSGRNLLGLIDQTLRLAELSATGQADSGANAKLGDVIQEAIARIESNTENCSIRSVLDSDQACLRIAGVHEDLCEAVYHILQNAVQFSPPGAPVTISLRQTIDTSVSLEISDVGKGIQPDVLDKIQEAFEQEAGAFARTHGGIGLGLTIAGSILRLYDGQIEIQSLVDKGTSVTLKLRRAEQDVELPLTPPNRDAAAA